MQSTIPTALVCSNSLLVRNFFEAILEGEFEMIFAQDAEEGLQKLAILDVHLIIFDEKVERCDIVSWVKKFRLISSAALLVIAGSLKKSYCRQLLTAGATDLVHYPLEKSEIKKQIAKAKKSMQMQSKVFSLRDTISTIGNTHTAHVNKSHSVTPTKEAINISITPSESIGVIILEVDQYGEKKHNWSDIDEFISVECESIIPIRADRRVFVFRNISRHCLDAIAKSLRQHFSICVGIGFSPKSNTKSAREQIEKVIAEAKENCK